MKVIKRISSWSRYHKQLAHIIAFAKTLSVEQLEFKMDEHVWSLRELFEHYYQVEFLSHQAMQERIDTGVIKRSEFKHKKRYWQLAWALRLPKKYPVPSAVRKAEKPYFEADFITQWENQHQAFEQFLTEIDGGLRGMLIFKHPIAGPMNADQTLGFLYHHLSHHNRQLDRIVKHPEFPKKGNI
jgi:hypothetical protein